MKLNKKYFVQIHEWMANTTTERSFNGTFKRTSRLIKVFLIFCLLMEGSESGSRSVQINYGSG